MKLLIIYSKTDWKATFCTRHGCLTIDVRDKTENFENTVIFFVMKMVHAISFKRKSWSACRAIAKQCRFYQFTVFFLKCTKYLPWDVKLQSINKLKKENRPSGLTVPIGVNGNCLSQLWMPILLFI